MRSPRSPSAGSGSAWAAAGDGYVLIGSPFEPDATELPLRAAFVPWVLEALSRRLGEDGRLIEAVPGEQLTGLRGVTGLEGLDGNVVGTNSDRVIVPNEAGVYYLRRQAARIGALVVNPEPEESDVVGMGQGGADSAVAAMRTHIAGRDVTPAASVNPMTVVMTNRVRSRRVPRPTLKVTMLCSRKEKSAHAP